MGFTRAQDLRLGTFEAALGGSLFLLSACVHADQWYTESLATLESFYDDNIRLSLSSPRSTMGARLRASVESGWRTEVSEVGLSAKAMSSQYADASDLNETDFSFGLTSSHQMGLSRFGLNAAFNYDSTLTSEVSTSGLVQAEKRRQQILLSPSWQYSLTPRAKLETSLSYQDIKYEDVDVIPLYDYRFGTLAMTLNYALSERASVLGRATYYEYEADAIDVRSDSYGVQAGVSYLLAEDMSLSSFAGFRRSHTETQTLFGTQDAESSGPVFDLELTKSYAQGKLRISAERGLLPSGNGRLLDTTSLRLSWDYALSPKSKLSLNAEGYRNRSSAGESTSSDRDYLSLSPRFRHQLSKALSLDLGYRYRWQEYDFQTDGATSNSVFFVVKYSMTK